MSGFPPVESLRFPGAPRQPRAAHPSRGDVVVIMGVPGAGKSCLAQTFVARGYTRLNRDEKGGSLAGLLPALDDAGESPLIVLDNTYASRQSRAAVVQAAWQKGLAVRCVWPNTSVEDAQVNAVERMLANHGRLLAGDEIRKARKRDPSVFAPTVQFRYQRELEPPDAAEGFATVEVVPFERRRDPSFVNRAVIVWCDGVLCRSQSGRRTPAYADDVEVAAGCGGGSAAVTTMVGCCSAFCGSRTRRLSIACGSNWASPSSSRTARTTRGHPSAGAASHCPASASCSFPPQTRRIAVHLRGRGTAGSGLRQTIGISDYREASEFFAAGRRTNS